MTACWLNPSPQPRIVAGAALCLARNAQRPARLLRFHRLHRAWRDGDCRRRLGRGQPQRRPDPRRPYAARRRCGVLADSARSETGGSRVPAHARPSVGRRRLARDGAYRRRQTGAGRTQGGRRQLPDARRVDARSQNAGRGFVGRARWRVRCRGRFHIAGAARSQARRPRHHRQRALPDPQRGRGRAGQARRQCRPRPAVSGQRGQPARHRPVAAGQPGALDLPRQTAGQCGRRSRRHPTGRRCARHAPASRLGGPQPRQRLASARAHHQPFHPIPHAGRPRRTFGRRRRRRQRREEPHRPPPRRHRLVQGARRHRP